MRKLSKSVESLSRALAALRSLPSGDSFTQAPPVGTEGTVRGVDDIGSVMVAWDNGCGLNVVLDEDEIEIIPAESNH